MNISPFHHPPVAIYVSIRARPRGFVSPVRANQLLIPVNSLPRSYQTYVTWSVLGSNDTSDIEYRATGVVTPYGRLGPLRIKAAANFSVRHKGFGRGSR